ncbi:MAG: asparagine synthase C-terminal domain-containing protein, partial [Candidatus Omnitrophica bacterium]|nr:asparagine synthase C-terminal domain-containing protein [Candidatus Omnitrophota bacterium]
ALVGEPSVLIRQGLEELMPLVLRSDVPVGIALSGGIDSGAIASLAAKVCKKDLFAFSVGYSGVNACDERKEARELAEHLGLRFKDVEIAVSDFARDFPLLVYAMDDPIADIAAYGYYSVMRLARQNNVPVMLSGFAGDELFWGYPWVKAAVNKNLKKLRSFSSRSFNPLSFLARKSTSPQNRMIFYDTSPNFQES